MTTKASPEETRKLLQADVRLEIDRVGTEQWTTVYSHDDTDDGNVVRFCALVPEKSVAKVLGRSSWDLSIGNGLPGFSQSYAQNKTTVTTYHRFGGEDEVEPLVFVRNFHGVKPAYIELSEEFRHLLNLYFDRYNGRYLQFDDNGDEEVVVEVAPKQVRIKTRKLRQFLAARGMRLAVYFDSVAYSSADPAELDPKEKEQEVVGPDRHYSFYVGDRMLADRPFSRVLGKRLVDPVPIAESGIWPYEEEKKKPHVEFIIGVDKDGKEIHHSSDPETLANYFGKNPEAPHFLTPIVFRREVLKKYFDHPEKYEISDGYLGCAGLWGLRLDNDSEDRVTVFLGDLGQSLSHEEQLYWRSFNVAPFGDGKDTSETNAKRSFAGVADVNYKDPLTTLTLPHRPRLQTACSSPLSIQ